MYGEAIYIEFYTYVYANHTGFQLDYTAICKYWFYAFKRYSDDKRASVRGINKNIPFWTDS